jgi:hypothetical protein
MSSEQSQSEQYAAHQAGHALNDPRAVGAADSSRDYGRQTAVIAGVLFLGLLVAGAFLIVSEVRGVNFATLTKDPVAAGGLDFEAGIMTRVEVIIWVGAAAAAVTASFVAQRLEHPESPILLSFGLLAFVMAVDDNLMIHEEISSLAGLPLIEFAYVGVIGLLLWKFRATILLQTPWLVLAAAIAGLGLSEAVDILDDHLGLGAGAGVEDVSKFFGILLFGAYLLLMTRRTVAGVVPPRPA